MFGFDGQRRDLDTTIQYGIGFEPWLWYWAPDPVFGGGVHKEVFRMMEAAHIDWSVDLCKQLNGQFSSLSVNPDCFAIIL